MCVCPSLGGVQCSFRSSSFLPQSLVSILLSLSHTLSAPTEAMTSLGVSRAYPLGKLSLRAVVLRLSSTPPQSPLRESGVFTACAEVHPSPTLSWVSAESLDGIISLVNRTDEEMELDRLIYRLCHSLYHVAQTKSAQIHRKPLKKWSGLADDDSGHFRNMRGHEDWCPLRHLFDPSSYYKAIGKSNPHVGCTCPGESHGPVSDPADVSERLVGELSVTRLSGGNSNHVYRLCHASFPGKAVLLRVYGNGGSDVIDRARDTMAMRLMSRAGMSPALLHSFHWGRVEEFMDGVYTCTTEMLLASPALLADIYEGVCQMHQLDATPFFPEKFDEGRGAVNASSRPASVDEFASLLEERDGYYSTMAHEKALESVCPTSFERVSLRLLRLISPHVVEAHRRALVDWIANEIMFVRRELQKRDVPVVFSHNDLNPGNILLSRRRVPARLRETERELSSDDEVTCVVSSESSVLSKRYVTRKGKSKNLVERRGYLFIDFEYADANYRCIDLGNTLCEMDYDYTRGTEAGGRGFIKYLFVFPPAAKAEAWRGLGEEYPRMPELIYDAWQRQSSVVDDADDIGSSALQALRRYFATRDGVPVDDVQLDKAQLGEVLLGMLASHLYWTLWAVAMGCSPDECADCAGGEASSFAVGGSGLDYVRYGECRLQEYIALRDWLVRLEFIV